jgi:hypothetical protein
LNRCASIDDFISEINIPIEIDMGNLD